MRSARLCLPLPNYPQQLTVLRKDELEGPQSHFKSLILKPSENYPWEVGHVYLESSGDRIITVKFPKLNL